MAPLETTHEHLFEKLEAQTPIAQFSNEEVLGFITIIQRSIQLAGHASVTLSQKRRVAVLTKFNKAHASLGKGDFPEADKDLFGQGLESRLKERTETAKAISEVKKVGGGGGGGGFFALTLHVAASTPSGPLVSQKPPLSIYQRAGVLRHSQPRPQPITPNPGPK